MAKKRKPQAQKSWGGYRPGAGRKPAASEVKAAEPNATTKIMRALARDAEHVRAATQAAAVESRNPFRLPEHPPRAMPSKHLRMAMDENLTWGANQWSVLGTGAALGAVGAQGLFFLGYPFLSELAQRPEYRVMSETIADDATRKWIDYDVVGDAEEMRARAKQDTEDPEGKQERREKRLKAADKMEKVKEIKDHQERIRLRDAMYALCRDDGFFGRAHMYMDFGTDLDGAGDDELRTPIGNGRDELSRTKVARNSFRAVRPIEAVWTYPMTYNAVNPLRHDWYNPQQWYVMGKELHVSRLLTFIGHPVPDLLKPAYSFGGISLSQLAKPYVDIWLKTRQSIGDLIHAFSVMVLSTDMQAILQDDGRGGLLRRMDTFNTFRDNKGTFLLNKATEEFHNVSVPLSGLHELQAQAQEHMMSVVRIPDVKFTGLNPTGLNASSEGVLRAYYDTIGAYQNRFQRPNLTRVINFEQLSLFGDIDPGITFNFEPLWEMNPKEIAELQKMEAERDQVYIDTGVLAPKEVRSRVIDDTEMPYADLNPEEVPELREEEEEGLEPKEGRPQPLAEAGPGLGSQPDNEAPPPAKDEEVPEVRGLPWGDLYEWMRGYDLPSHRGETAIAKEPPAGSEAARKGLRVGSRVSYERGGERRPGRVFGFVANDEGAATVAILDAEIDAVRFVGDDQVSPRAVLSEDRVPFASDADWDEAKHKRRKDGKFGSGGGGASSESAGGAGSEGEGGDDKPLRKLDEKEQKIWDLNQKRLKILSDENASAEDYEAVEAEMEKLGWQWGDAIPGSRDEERRRINAEIEKEEAEKARRMFTKATPEYTMAMAKQISKKMGFDISKIQTTDEVKTFSLNGRDYKYAGSCDLSTGEIMMYTEQLTEASAAGVVAHEIEHAKFQKVINTVREDAHEVMKKIRKYDEGKPRKEEAMKPDGSLREPYASEFPLYTAWHEAYGSKDHEVFANSDGVSNYSEEYWKAWRKGECSTDIAFHETLAEMARIRLETGTWPEHRWSPGEASLHQKRGRIAEKAHREGAKAWRNLFKLVDKIYKDAA